MLILVVNAGSSSLKYQLLNMDDESVLAKGNCDRIGIDGHISHKTADGRTYDADCAFPTHTEAFMKLVEVLTKGDAAVIKDMSEIAAVGHRIVQGAEVFSETTLDSVNEVVDTGSLFGSLSFFPQPSKAAVNIIVKAIILFIHQFLKCTYFITTSYES